jgi:hypothetical protein
VVAASAADAHRALGPEHDLGSALSRVEKRQVSSDYTIRNDGRMYRIAAKCIQPGMRGGTVRIEMRLDGSMAVSFRGKICRGDRVRHSAETRRDAEEVYRCAEAQDHCGRTHESMEGERQETLRARSQCAGRRFHQPHANTRQFRLKDIAFGKPGKSSPASFAFYSPKPQLGSVHQ